MITSISNGKVKQIVQWQSKARERRRDGIFLAEGGKMFEEAPEAWIREVYVSRDFMEKAKEKHALYNKLRESNHEIVSPEVFRKISDTQTPQGILTVLERPMYHLEEMLNRPEPFLMILENLQDPGNLGTILRTGEGAGITGVIISENSVDLYNPKTIRSTMGSIYRVPHVCVEHLPDTLAAIKEHGVRIYAAHLKGERTYDSFSFRGPTAFLIGNEGNGLTQESADAADAYLRIPMEGQVESLNAAVAAALLMYETHRQRRHDILL